MNTQTAAAARTAPLAYWRIAEAFLHVLHSLFGAPEDVARQHTLVRKAHDLLASWLRAGEAMLRRLLMIEAAAIEAPFRPAARRPAKRSRIMHAVSPEEPDTWRVSFRSALGRAGRRRHTRGPGRETRFLSAWPLAERYEAMIRVFNAPFGYALRLARRLHAKPELVAVILYAPPEYGHRIDLADEMTEKARLAWRRPDSS